MTQQNDRSLLHFVMGCLDEWHVIVSVTSAGGAKQTAPAAAQPF